MEGLYGELVDFTKLLVLPETEVKILLCAVLIWAAVMIGLVVGGSRRPLWTGLEFLGLRSKLRFLCAFAFTALSAFCMCLRLWTKFKGQEDGDEGKTLAAGLFEAVPVVLRTTMDDTANGHINCEVVDDDQEVITKKDLEHFLHLLDDKDRDSVWQNLMEHTTPNMSYQVWRHEPKVGPVIYHSRTVFEDANPELVRDFFWDDEFRPKWNTMLAYFKVLEEFSERGEMIVHWIKKFPFFCSDREYIIGRRIWESGKTYYCVTKGVPYPTLCKKDKPRRVEIYFSSWRISEVESRRLDEQLTACEVALIHYEDMGISKDVAKFGVRHGMWGAVKRLQSGLRAYQLARKSGMPLSRTALMAHNTSKIPSNPTICLSDSQFPQTQENNQEHSNKMINNSIDWRWVVVGGTVAIFCGFQMGIIGKSLLLGAARRLQKK